MSNEKMSWASLSCFVLLQVLAVPGCFGDLAGLDVGSARWQPAMRSRLPAHRLGRHSLDSAPPQVLAAPALRREFGELAEVDMGDAKTGSLADWADAQRRSANFEIWCELGPWVEQHRPPFGEDVAPQLRRASEITAEEVCHIR